ncbi:xanthine dehydrogenase family protein subunit M [Bradyrhizobium sp. ARR65]|uniref:FAD binding domain-containing protein n=1 Tax=Bradyrhizobium sp. ARR65 TaxID=1040989 RepID=UPI0004671C42|nr:xanthine dehydrogenase family protein subunit M [Bradyrhizobium sp. ARR65]
MKPAPFKYIKASSVAHALSLKAEYGDDGRFLAGGQSLIPALNFRLARPAVLIDINGLAELEACDCLEGGRLRLGALTRYRTLERNGDLLRACPLFADALPHIAHPQIRNRGTVGGNLSHADPASELPAVTVAMRARMRVKSEAGERELDAADFFVGLLTTDLRPDEMLIDVTLPVQKPRSGGCFLEVARRRGDFALAGCAAVITLDDGSRCTDVRLALCGVGETPVDASGAAAALIGEKGSDKLIDAVATDVQRGIAPAGNVHASPDYQRHLAGVLSARALRKALQRVAHAA